MVAIENLVLVFVAGLITALATGLGAIPFFFVEDFSDRWNVGLWGTASGIMVTVSVFGLADEGLAYASSGIPTMLILGLLAGVALVEIGDLVLNWVDIDDGTGSSHDHEHDADVPETEDIQTDGAGHGHDDHAVEAKAIAEGNPKTLLLILGILTIHSFPEGVAVGVSFAELGFDGGLSVLGFSIPLLAVFMTVAISIHNIPEGTAIAIPMRAMGLSKWRMVGAAVFSSLPQPIGAVIAYGFVSWARDFLPFGFGFAAGAMVYLVATEFIPEALETGEELPGNGYKELAAGFGIGTLAMLPLMVI
ncbi:putative divalent heavy-metal cations transporter [Halovivax ruber XH-70]|uniref:Putative divalent heavy-metal cations transporter n=1 Tax=Halovivax ruber (strain DSM 18193 / JCM 13892 / XH-70) TaxID=797302 RepID=L0IC75_HALRX|nr:ZIP family metal transporter [Halovivax ruber]AGB15806.1 putative divalent heavy-metal cations transporter [Halovivax ruber XH-70]